MRPVGQITFFPDGRAGAIASDALRPFFERLGSGGVRRASDVEPCDCRPGCLDWVAEIRPWVPGGAVRLGPFRTRAAALEAEVSHLRSRLRLGGEGY